MNATRGRARRSGVCEVVPVGAGLALIALSAYAVLAMAGHVLAPADYAAVGSLYLLVSILGPGIFVAVEQQTAREVAARETGGLGWAPVLRGSVSVSAQVAGVVTLGVLVSSPVLVPRVFGGSWLLLGGALAAVWGAAAGYPLRGVYAGRRSFGWYGGCMALEGIARTAACAGLVGLGVTGGGWYGLVFGLGLVISAVLTLAGPRSGGPGPALPHRRLSAQIWLLAGGCGLTLVVANLGPVVLTARLGSAATEQGMPAAIEHGMPVAAQNSAVAASFVSLFVLARIPVLVVTPVQAILLPLLTAAVERGALDVVRGLVGKALLGVLALGLPGVAAGAVLGPRAAEVFFDAPLRLSWLVAAMLGVGTVGMVAAQILQPALVALGRNRSAMTAWGIGTAVFAVLLALPGIPLAACVAAQVVAPTVVTALMLRALARELRDRAERDGQTYTATTSSANQTTAST